MLRRRNVNIRCRAISSCTICLIVFTYFLYIKINCITFWLLMCRKHLGVVQFPHMWKKETWSERVFVLLTNAKNSIGTTCEQRVIFRDIRTYRKIRLKRVSIFGTKKGACKTHRTYWMFEKQVRTAINLKRSCEWLEEQRNGKMSKDS